MIVRLSLLNKELLTYLLMFLLTINRVNRSAPWRNWNLAMPFKCVVNGYTNTSMHVCTMFCSHMGTPEHHYICSCAIYFEEISWSFTTLFMDCALCSTRVGFQASPFTTPPRWDLDMVGLCDFTHGGITDVFLNFFPSSSSLPSLSSHVAVVVWPISANSIRNERNFIAR